MNLIEILTNFPAENLKNLAQRWGIHDPVISKRLLVNSLVAFMRSNKNFKHIVKCLSPEAELLLKYITHFENKGFTIDNNFAKSVSLYMLKDNGIFAVLKELKNNALIYKVSTGEPTLYEIPKEIRPLLEEVFPPLRNDRKEIKNVKPKEILREDETLLPDLFSLLFVIDTEEIRLNRSSELFKRAKLKIESLWKSKTDRWLLESNEAIYHHNSKLDFLLRFSRARGLVKVEDHKLISDENLHEWCSQSDWKIRNDIYDYFLKMYASSDIQLSIVINLISDLPLGAEWVPLDWFVNKIVTYIEKKTGVREKIYWVLHTLMQMEIVELGSFPDHSVGVRITPTGFHILQELPFTESRESKTEFFIGPDFEIHLDRTTSFADRWKLAQMADLIKDDVIYIYKITQDSFMRGLKSAGKPGDLLEYLVSHSRNPLPQNVEYTLKAWTESFGRISFQQVVLLRCDSEELASEVAALPVVSNIIRERITPKDLIIPADRFDIVLEQLELKGYFPRPDLEIIS